MFSIITMNIISARFWNIGYINIELATKRRHQTVTRNILQLSHFYHILISVENTDHFKLGLNFQHAVINYELLSTHMSHHGV